MQKMMFKNIVIAGAGLMGASIAQIFPQHGYRTTIYSHKDSSFKRAREIIANCQSTLVDNNVLTAQESQKIQENIIYTTDLNCFKDADLVIEAISEVFDIKVEFFKKITKILPENSIIATNTSAISINDLGEHIENPERFCGTHWLNPPHIIPLVEITKGKKTKEWVTNGLVKLLNDIGKEAVILKKDIKGFLSNRLQFALLREASYLVESGVATPEDIDRTLKYGNGIRYSCSGPFKIVDLGGVQVFNNVAKYLFPVLSKEDTKSDLLMDMVKKGLNGISTEKGFYEYTKQSALEEEKERDRKMINILRI